MMAVSYTHRCRAVNPKRALIPAPTFAEYGQALASMGCELEYYMLTENDGFVLGDSYLDILHKGLDIAFLCNPNNPTGMLIPHRLLKKILEKCRKLEILLVVDECFLDFVKEPQEYSLKRSLSGFNNLFILKAFTKRYAMAGVRLGYGLCLSLIHIFYASQQKRRGFSSCIMSEIPCKCWVSCFFFIAFYGTIRAVKKEQKTYGW